MTTPNTALEPMTVGAVSSAFAGDVIFVRHGSALGR
jgi:hypothetical protein